MITEQSLLPSSPPTPNTNTQKTALIYRHILNVSVHAILAFFDIKAGHMIQTCLQACLLCTECYWLFSALPPRKLLTIPIAYVAKLNKSIEVLKISSKNAVIAIPDQTYQLTIHFCAFLCEIDRDDVRGKGEYMRLGAVELQVCH